jgi:hypothetical protein
MERQPFAPQMTAEFKQEVETAKPAYLVLSGVRASWGVGLGSDTSVMQWAAEYTTRCYDIVGIAEIDVRGPARIRWDSETTGYQPQSQSQVMVYRRKPAC